MNLIAYKLIIQNAKNQKTIHGRQNKYNSCEKAKKDVYTY